MDQGFGRIDFRQDRQDGAIRHMMAQMSMRVPDFFQPFINPGQFAVPGGFDTSAPGSSTQQGGSGAGPSGQVDPTPDMRFMRIVMMMRTAMKRWRKRSRTMMSDSRRQRQQEQ